MVRVTGLRMGMAAVALVAAGLVNACSKGNADAPQRDASMTTAMNEGAEYTVVFRSTWTPANHPFEYPTAGALTGPHFSGLIGASHDSAYTLFAVGSLPTPGLENLSEQGKHAPLDQEIRQAETTGHVGALFETGGLRNFGDSLVATVKVDKAHPLISLVAMVAPSPDWFTGAANINLMEDGGWVASRTLELHAYDSGGDDGMTYKAPDMDNNPKKATTQAATRHFVIDGRVVPVATLTIRKN